jgi:hypothetical protein
LNCLLSRFELFKWGQTRSIDLFRADDQKDEGMRNFLIFIRFPHFFALKIPARH